MAALINSITERVTGKLFNTHFAIKHWAILALLLSITLILPGFTELGHSNLVPDPSFENGTGNWNLRDYASSIDSSMARTGSQSIKLINDASQSDHNAGQYNIGGVQAGVEYEYSVWVRGDNITGVGPGGKPLAVIRWRDSSGQRLEKEMYLWAPYGTYNWVNDKIYLQAPPNAAKVDITFRSWFDCLTGTSNWDDVSLTPRDLSHRGGLAGGYQAEDATDMNGGQIESSETNYTGSGYFETASDGAYLEWNNISGGVNGGTRILSFRYALEGNAKDWEVFVNGTSQGVVKSLATGQINSWASSDWQVDLQPGDNTIRVKVITVTAGPLIDKLDVYYLAGETPPASAPSIEPDGGAFTDSVDVSLQTTTPGASIYYSTDGSTPTTDSTRYTEPIRITSDATVKAITKAVGYIDSDVVSADFTITYSGQQVFGGTPWPVPGTIEAEDYDIGGEGVAYHNLSAGNDGGEYRSDDVDIWASADAGGGYFTGPNSTQEWLEYTVNVQSAGQYSLDLRVATPDDDRLMHVEVDGADVSGEINVPNTGGWDAWQVVMTSINLSRGEQVIRVVFDSGGLNFDRMDINSIGLTVATPTITPGAGIVDFPLDVELACATDGATIYYTTDGTVPTAGSNQYTAPFSLTADTTVNAYAVASGYNDSAVANAAFTSSSPSDQPTQDGGDGDDDTSGEAGTGGGGGGGCFLSTAIH